MVNFKVPDLPKTCPTCGRKMPADGSDTCPACRTTYSRTGGPRLSLTPWLAAALGIIFCGWGHWYCGRTREGLKYFGGALLALLAGSFLIFFVSSIASWPAVIAGIICVIAGVAIWITGVRDAYLTALRINRGELPFTRRSGLFELPFVVLIILVLFILSTAIGVVFLSGSGLTGTGGIKYVEAKAYRTDDGRIEVQYTGGHDHYMVTTLTYSVDDAPFYPFPNTKVGTFVIVPGPSPQKDHVVMIAKFLDNSTQTILDTHV